MQKPAILDERQHTSLTDLADELAEAGLRTKTGGPYSAERVRKLLRHPFYKGAVVYRGDVRPGHHQAIVPLALWDAVQDTLARRHVDTGEKGSRFFLLRGLLWCATCGRRYTAEAHPKGSYYRCVPDRRREPCRAPFAPLRVIEAEVEALLPQLVVTDAQRADIAAALQGHAAEQAAVRAREESGLLARRDHLEAKLLRLGSAFGDGAMPREEYQVLRKDVDTELRQVVGRLDMLSRDVEAEVADALALLERASLLPDLYAAASDPEERKALLFQVFHRIEVEDRRIVRIEYNPPFAFIFDPRSSAGSRDDVAHALLDRTGQTAVSS